MYNPTPAVFDPHHAVVVDENSRSSTASYASSTSTDSGVNGFEGWQKAGATEYNNTALRVDGPGPSPELRKTLDAYAQLANATLLTAMELGTVIIITNAETGWLPLTCAKFLPSLLSTVNSIYHTSARSTYEPQGFASAFDWKDQAFRHSIASHFSEVPFVPGRRRCVISLGDSAHERMAAIYACREFNEQSMIDSSSPAGLLCKSLKFMERPDLEHLRKEQYLIQDCLAQVVRYDQDLDLCIQPQQCLVKDDIHGNQSSRMQQQQQQY
ncbi:hypothetical protein FOZ60_011465 [Perkinsus olseni]|uniref:Uncharacterized protein n=2 Tax=Perkinsus olseni TaxID=32597 RepID=A0A7J6PAU6_PEROL|nr:hypothetical protein FOZ60_011465 [Perkinsus olseni]